MYCPNCGCYNDENAAFCGSCGTPLRTEQSGREQPGQTAGGACCYRRSRGRGIPVDPASAEGETV